MTQAAKLKQLEHYGFGPNVMRRTKLCPACGRLVTDGSHSCPVCGRRLPALTLLAWYEQQHSTCAYCRTLLSSDAQYCPHCGRRVAHGRAEEPPAAEDPAR